MVLKQIIVPEELPEVWEWCKNVWYSNLLLTSFIVHEFENDVKMYGTQTSSARCKGYNWFENDVKMYGTQTYSIQ